MGNFRERLAVREPVGDSADLDRVLALPRRPRLDLRSPRARALVHVMTERLRRERVDPCACVSMGRPCVEEFLPAQAWALWELLIYGVLCAPIGVGHGKTALDFMIPLVLKDCKVVALFVPPGLRVQLWDDYRAWSEHFRVPTLLMDDGRGRVVPGAPVVHVIPYSRLSRPESTALLEQLRPDTIIADEAHRLKDVGGAGAGRVARFMERHPETRFVPESGTMTSRGPADCAHLMAWALGEGSPLPLDPRVSDEWDMALGAHEWPAPSGRLRRLCRRGEEVQEAFSERLTETPGVVATTHGAVAASINLRERHLKTPPAVASLLAQTRESWERPDGEEFVEIFEVHACVRQLAMGFYYRWRFPRGESRALIDEWFDTRKSWGRELRERLTRPTEHLDSPQLLLNAAERHHAGYVGPLPTWASDAWPAWSAVKDLVYHETETVWVDDFLCRDAAAWAEKSRGIVWCEHDAVRERIAALMGVPSHGGGPGAEARIAAETGRRSIVASIKAHGTGRDGLQRKFATQLITSPPANGEAWEQLLGRLHRVGQAADEVDAWVYRHEPELRAAVDQAVLQAKYVRHGSFGGSQKLLVASCDFELDR